MDELAAIEANTNPTLAHIPRKLRELVVRRVVLHPQEENTWNTNRKTQVVVRSSGPLSHIYFSADSDQMDLSEITYLYPNLVSSLLQHPGIGLVVGRELGQLLMMSKEGVLSLDSGYHVEGGDPLANLPDPRLTAEQLREMAGYRHAGDLILLGSYDAGEQLITCFEPQWACHGGVGGPQEFAFMIKTGDLDWDIDHITDATQIYPFFAQRYGASSETS
jgi:hypothetical protein